MPSLERVSTSTAEQPQSVDSGCIWRGVYPRCLLGAYSLLQTLAVIDFHNSFELLITIHLIADSVPV